MKYLLALATLLTFTVTASATSGAVNARGCHGHPKHCHAAGEITTSKRGFRFVAGWPRDKD